MQVRYAGCLLAALLLSACGGGKSDTSACAYRSAASGGKLHAGLGMVAAFAIQ